MQTILLFNVTSLLVRSDLISNEKQNFVYVLRNALIFNNLIKKINIEDFLMWHPHIPNFNI